MERKHNLRVANLRGDPGLEIILFILIANICHHICMARYLYSYLNFITKNYWWPF